MSTLLFRISQQLKVSLNNKESCQELCYLISNCVRNLRKKINNNLDFTNSLIFYAVCYKWHEKREDSENMNYYKKYFKKELSKIVVDK